MRSQAMQDVPKLGNSCRAVRRAAGKARGAQGNTAPEIIDTLNRAVDDALVDPNFKAGLADPCYLGDAD